jgi:hypothetical protein
MQRFSAGKFCSTPHRVIGTVSPALTAAEIPNQSKKDCSNNFAPRYSAVYFYVPNWDAPLYSMNLISSSFQQEAAAVQTESLDLVGDLMPF